MHVHAALACTHMEQLHAHRLVLEPDPSHCTEEGSGHVPTFELSSRNAIMRGN